MNWKKIVIIRWLDIWSQLCMHAACQSKHLTAGELQNDLFPHNACEHCWVLPIRDYITVILRIVLQVLRCNRAPCNGSCLLIMCVFVPEDFAYSA